MKLSLKKDLTPLKDAAILRVDAWAGSVRSRYITVAPGQELVYAEKVKEAEAFLRDIEQSGASLPHLSAEAGMNGISLLDQAVEYVSMAKQWSEVSAAIETQRLTAKAMVTNASSPAEIEAVISSIG